RLRTLLRSRNSQLLSFQSFPHSLKKTWEVEGGRITSPKLFKYYFNRLSDEDSRPERAKRVEGSLWFAEQLIDLATFQRSPFFVSLDGAAGGFERGGQRFARDADDKELDHPGDEGRNVPRQRDHFALHVHAAVALLKSPPRFHAPQISAIVAGSF